MKNTIIGLLTFTFIFLIVTDVNAQKRREMRENQGRMHEQLNLTDQQKIKLDELRIKHQEQMIDFRAELDKARLEMQKLRKSDKLNRSDVINQTKKMSSIRNKIAEARANHMMDMYEMLTDEQRKIWNDLKMDRPKLRDSGKKGLWDRGFKDRGKRF